MSPAYKAIPTKPFLKGLMASSDPYTQPGGTFPRGSNLLLNKRGALDVCDGTQLVHAFNGQVQSGRGKILCTFLFSPTGVSSYYLALAQALDLPLGPPLNLAVATAGGGLLGAGTYYYLVTALDGVGGETTSAGEVAVATGANGKNTLTWGVVPNAAGYNVYRSSSAGTEVLLTGSSSAVLPVPQVATGGLSVSFVDDGTTSTGPTLPIFAISKGNNDHFDVIVVIAGAGFPNLAHGLSVMFTGVTPATFNGTFPIDITTGPNVVSVVNPSVPKNTSGTGGTITLSNNIPPPLVDTTQQIVLFRMPVIVGSPASLPVSYNNSNIVALFPANLTFLASGGTSGGVSGGGGGGSGGGGGTGGGGAGGGRGGPINIF